MYACLLTIASYDLVYVFMEYTISKWTRHMHVNTSYIASVAVIVCS